jgi:hypothetical protein
VIAKVHGLVLNNLLNAWAESTDVHCVSQAGCRPADNTHMNTFVLLNIIDTYELTFETTVIYVAALIYTRHMTVSYVARRSRDCMMWVFVAVCFMPLLHFVRTYRGALKVIIHNGLSDNL